MKTVRYSDESGADGNALVEVRDGRVVLDTGDERLSFELRELRAAIETEAFEHGPVIPGGPGAKVGRRSA